MFQAPRDGVYLITFSYQSMKYPGKGVTVYIYKNGGEMYETKHYTYYSTDGSGYVTSTGGLSMYVRLKVHDNLKLRPSLLRGADMDYIMFCVQFINN